MIYLNSTDMFRSFLWFLLITSLMSSCIEPDDSISVLPSFADVYEPVYADPATSFQIIAAPTKPIINPAKIFTYEDFLIVNIKGEGFHVINNIDPSFPVPLFFINVPGSNDVAIKDGYIYTDNYSDIVAFRITENQEVETLKRLSNVMNNQEYPPLRGVYFECVDLTKGVVIDWVISNKDNVKCYRP
ncbi:MAG: hypothetical protein ACI92W_003165 [Paraglaciecola sp.]|jgi:hypothetical protein